MFQDQFSCYHRATINTSSCTVLCWTSMRKTCRGRFSGQERIMINGHDEIIEDLFLDEKRRLIHRRPDSSMALHLTEMQQSRIQIQPFPRRRQTLSVPTWVDVWYGTVPRGQASERRQRYRKYNPKSVKKKREKKTDPRCSTRPQMSSSFNTFGHPKSVEY
jgi:hypothetical protein